MKKFLFIPFILFWINTFAQIQNVNPDPNGEPWILGGYREPSPDEVAKIPHLVIPQQYKSDNLPEFLDNSTKPYFRPIFNQDDGSCAQASGVAYNFTYEINRLRRTSANVSQNQFPSHYTYNFLNQGNGNNGSWYVDGWQIIKANGCPTVATYGGISQPANYWMSGYDKYKAGQQFRVDEIFAIDVSTIEGLNTLKQWIYNHGDGSLDGGIVNFAAGITYGNYYMDDATKIVVSWDVNVNHAMTFVGWNDNIGWDYNSDGQITNNIDINGDNIIDLRDWEKGCMIMVNSWGTSWGNQGKAYVPYRLLALPPSQGGIGGGNLVYSIKVKASYSPTLFLNAKISHQSRQKIKIQAGISTDINSTEPQHILSFPLFNFQGGNYPMQGTNSNPIDITLDITPLLQYITPNQQAKYFLQIVENDPQNTSSGTIQYFSIQKNGSTEIPCTQSNVAIQNNTTTTLSINASIDFNPPTIQTNSLPNAFLSQNYSTTLSASGGTNPLKWYIKTPITQSDKNENFPIVTTNQLQPNDLDDGFASKTIDFDFPFFGKTYRDLYIRTDGSIAFEPGFTYIRSNEAIKNNKIISVFASDLMIYPSDNDGIFYQGNENYATFRWKTSLYEQQSANIDVAITLYPNGDIKFFYNSNITPDIDWASGISNGDGINYLISSFSGIANPSNRATKFTYSYPHGISLYTNGVLSGTPLFPGTYNLNFIVFDYNNLAYSKNIVLNVLEPNALNSENLDLTIYPNPFTDFISIVSNNDIVENIDICDIQNKIVYQQRLFSNNTNLNLNNLQPGLYFLKITTNKNIHIFKIIKQ